MKRDKKLEVGTAVAVQWTDHCSRSGWFHHTRISEIKDPLSEHVTHGYVGANLKDALCITHTFTEEGGEMDPLMIDWRSIKGVRTVGRKWDRDRVERLFADR